MGEARPRTPCPRSVGAQVGSVAGGGRGGRALAGLGAGGLVHDGGADGRVVAHGRRFAIGELAPHGFLRVRRVVVRGHASLLVVVEERLGRAGLRALP